MSKIDLKDKKILYELDLDCRQSNTQIGKKVGLKKDVVAYRINKMQDEGIIKNFWTAINTFKLGYHVYRVYINFQYVGSSLKNEIIQHFVNYKNTWTVLSIKAEVDLDVIVWVKDPYEFYQFWHRTLELYEEYFAKYTISIYIQSFAYNKSYLLPEGSSKSDKEMYITTCTGKPTEIDETDYQLLNEIAVNARTPLIDLAKRLNCSSQTVNYRLKNLIKSDVVQAFRVALDLSKLNLQHFKLEIFLRDNKKSKAIWDYLKSKPYLEYLNVAVGWCDLEFELIVENVNKLGQIMEEIDLKFPNTIKKQSFWIIEKRHKDRWIPELVF
jgi:DNA-binding Lrp family transcriptional regulator